MSPELSIGGPASAKLKDLAEFVEACRAWGVPVGSKDFVSSHYYPTDGCIQANSSTSNLDCFTDGIIAARKQVPNQTFLVTGGWALLECF